MPRQSDNKKEKRKEKTKVQLRALSSVKLGELESRGGRARDLILMAEMEKEINNERVR